MTKYDDMLRLMREAAADFQTAWADEFDRGDRPNLARHYKQAADLLSGALQSVKNAAVAFDAAQQGERK